MSARCWDRRRDRQRRRQRARRVARMFGAPWMVGGVWPVAYDLYDEAGFVARLRRKEWRP